MKPTKAMLEAQFAAESKGATLTTPTQAQREAAARAMFELEYKLMGSDWVIPEWDESHRSYWVPLASAALAAAAKVDCTTPTQAQIEAARKLLRNSSCFSDEVCSLLPCKCIEEAITAAAKVGGQTDIESDGLMSDSLVNRLRSRKAFGLNGATWMMLNEPDPDCQSAANEIERLTAAAEVGGNWEQSADGKETIGESRQALEAEIERLKVQVIERDSAIAGWIKRTAAAEVGEIKTCPHCGKQL